MMSLVSRIATLREEITEKFGVAPTVMHIGKDAWDALRNELNAMEVAMYVSLTAEGPSFNGMRVVIGTGWSIVLECE